MKSKLITGDGSPPAEFNFPCLVRNDRGTVCLATSESGGVVLVAGRGSVLTVGHVFPPDDKDRWDEDGWTPITDSKVTIEFRA